MHRSEDTKTLLARAHETVQQTLAQQKTQSDLQAKQQDLHAKQQELQAKQQEKENEIRLEVRADLCNVSILDLFNRN